MKNRIMAKIGELIQKPTATDCAEPDRLTFKRPERCFWPHELYEDVTLCLTEKEVMITLTQLVADGVLEDANKKDTLCYRLKR
jgi:hypothetical protein